MNNWNLYLVPFAVSFLLSILFIFGIKYWASNFWKNEAGLRLGNRHNHQKNISRFGGLAIASAFLVAILINDNLILTKDIWGILLGGIVVLLVGLWDDLRELSWRKQFIFQILAISLIFIFGSRISYVTNPLGDIIYFNGVFGLILGIFIGLIWSLILMNSMNWLDGIDGLSGGIYLIGLVAIFLLSLKPEVNQPPVGIITMALSGALLGFLIFNFPPAQIMAGSSGIFFMGFIMAGLSIFAGTKIATTLLILFIPMVDFFWVIGKRLKSRKSIFNPGREHLHHQLLNIGWSPKEINIFFYLITIIVATVALNVGGIGKVIVMLFLTGAMLIFYNFISQKRKRHLLKY